ncbi:spore maturation protein [Jeotgalibacillus haloalkalitolerans]|uniref:Spore maturation protein n=1 Tax=Jeotgalibacillus haloalkalitolerans TaxID=3104292 RepID=A0ABU5KLD5_9BACL|nr:nucleoside recognition domain-containing protein [Jeotgalibacillus sp. HH7-29]MDZ5712054.1 spore maturation protein [Jeotgalibacillus sp. HH7-29]
MIDLISLSKLILPLLILTILFAALITKTDAYSAFVSGGKEGLHMAAELLPFLVGMMAAISVLRSSGLLLWITNLVSPLFLYFSIPAEIFPLFLTRPISGTAALSITADLTHTYGPEHMISRLAAVIQGSTDTTLYILTVYFGAVGIKKMGRALMVGLLADLTGMILAVVITIWYFQNVWS